MATAPVLDFVVFLGAVGPFGLSILMVSASIERRFGAHPSPKAGSQRRSSWIERDSWDFGFFFGMRQS